MGCRNHAADPGLLLQRTLCRYVFVLCVSTKENVMVRVPLDSVYFVPAKNGVLHTLYGNLRYTGLRVEGPNEIPNIFRCASKQVANRVLQDAGVSEGAEPIVVVGSDTIVDVRTVGAISVEERALFALLLSILIRSDTHR